MTDQSRLFFDDILDALRTVVQALGGSKVVGAKLWPDKAADAAGRQLSDCLNSAKAEKLSPDQVLLILRWGHEIGCHVGMQFIAQQCGYNVEAVSPQAERDRLADAILEGSRTLAKAMEIAERLNRPRAA